MNVWCADCKKFTQTVDCYCVSCGTDLLWAPQVNKKTCAYCLRTESVLGTDLCAGCAADILTMVGEDMEMALDAFRDLCPYCLVRLISPEEEECKTCRTADAWEADPGDVSWAAGGGYTHWPPEPEPVLIPSIAEELETIPAIRP